MIRRKGQVRKDRPKWSYNLVIRPTQSGTTVVTQGGYGTPYILLYGTVSSFQGKIPRSCSNFPGRLQNAFFFGLFFGHPRRIPDYPDACQGWNRRLLGNRDSLRVISTTWGV